MKISAHTFANRAVAEAHYLGLVDVWAAEKRRIDPAQAELYQRKANEARAGGGALLEAEAEATGSTVEYVCQSVLQEHTRREQFVFSIELKRVGAKAAIRREATAAGMHAIHKQLISEVPNGSPD